MPESVNLQKAQLTEIEFLPNGNVRDGQKKVTVQFNPETLKLSFANQVVEASSASGSNQQSSGAGSQSAGTAGRQFVGAGTTKLALQLWFDVTAPQPEGGVSNAPSAKGQVDDVRKLTQEVVFFITPKQSPQKPAEYSPPGVRFSWGSLIFEGVLDSLEESLEFFSSEGKPLRASMSLNLSQQKILSTNFGANPAPDGGALAGTQPLTTAAAGATLQGLAARAGLGDNWQAIAAANGIENPRQLQPGQLVNLNVGL
ncbi:MAG: LysM peptidoglycan-binding domain-containing protein [Acidobacteria bacterium]|nr:LysM peptidoglycan-binding domain-containing protein [Acidobacteriota bacterium]MBI3428094.1 LysM peptidoglycan-binding domain-containing protein [Acidobacteriota bacterium]